MKNQIPEILPNKDKSYYGNLFDKSFELLEGFYAPFKGKGLNSASAEDLLCLDELLKFQAQIHSLYRGN